jgi:acyl-CoA hydrolase
MPGCSGQSPLFDQLLVEAGGMLGDTEFSGIFIPTVNTVDYAAMGGGCRSEVFFLMPELRQSYRNGRVRYLPIPYTAITTYLHQREPYDLCLVQLAPPDEQGQMSFGVSADFPPISARNSRRILAQVNPRMPRTQGPSLHLDDVDYIMEADTPLLEVAPTGQSATLGTIARHIAEAIPDGATLQFGLGKAQRAMLEALTDHRDLAIHSGMVSDPVLQLQKAGALRQTRDAITTGTLLGSEQLYRDLPASGQLRLAPTSYTHHPGTLCNIHNFCSVNSALAVDLLGQINADIAEGAQVSGCGGLGDFMRGARLSPDGQSFIALPATAAGGTVSRIQLSLDVPPVSIARGDIDCVVTEYGIARLRHLDVEERAHALIAIAAPAFRDALSRDWRALRRKL